MASNPCPTNNPCGCIQKSHKPVVKPTCPKKGDQCLRACKDILACEDAVGPCAQVGTFDLSTLNHNTSGCAGDLKWSIDCYDEDIFLQVSVDRNTGVITWTTRGPETVGKFGEITFIIECESECENCLALKSAGTLTIGVKDLCVAHSCQDKCEECDPCTGECIDISGSVKIEE